MFMVQVKGSRITTNSLVIGTKTRNSSHFRKLNDHNVTKESTIDSCSDSQDVSESITENHELNQDSSHN